MNKGFVVLGDTHGNHGLITHRIKSLQMENNTLFHVGDFGVGFAKTEEIDIENMMVLNKLLSEKNCHLYVIRGNHDKPTFFEGNHDYSNLHLMPDYSVIEVNGDNVLMVGGAVSVDRKMRMDGMIPYKDFPVRETYWSDEVFSLDEEKLETMRDIKYVITHSATKHTHPINNFFNVDNSHGPLVQRFVDQGDVYLKDELNKERISITKMYDILIKNNDISTWWYGHFHTHKEELYEGVKFILLDINEFYNVKQ
jgi:predicted phosphodiesterase